MNERKRYSDLWEIFREPVRPGDPDYVDCEPDFRVSEITEITPQMLAQLGIRHALIDLDGTLVCPPSREINP
ncbi:MAG TPA: hypothetical protein VLG67_03715, partial [Candidatus Saccharimonadales bacterium]|nr:hypothetical protein [Candidatus Saccharimonadales bacterium]